MQAIGQQPQRAPDGAPVHYERHGPEQTTVYRMVQQHAATFFAQAEDVAGADLPQFVKVKFDAFVECGILANGFLRLHCGDSGHDKLVAFGCKRRDGVVTADKVPATLQRTAAVVDGPERRRPAVLTVAGHLGTSIAYQAALHLVFNGLVQPSGCTRSLLHATRSEVDGGASLAGSLHTGRWPRL